MKGLRLTQHTPPARFDPKWHVIDASGKRLGHLAVAVAGLLQGKHKPDYSRHLLNGDFVVIVNASRVEVSGQKLSQKTYYHHTGYVGHLRAVSLERMLQTHPDRVIQRAVKGMLPRTRLGRQMLRRLKVYSDATHPHTAQVNAGTGRAGKAAAAPAPQRRAFRPKAEAPARRPRRAEVAQEPAATPAPKARRSAQAKAPARPRRGAETTEAAPATRGRRTAPAKAEAPEATVAPAPRRRQAPRTRSTSTTPRRRRATPAPDKGPQEASESSSPGETAEKESAES